MKRMIHPNWTLWVFIILFAFVSCEEKEDAAPDDDGQETVDDSKSKNEDVPDVIYTYQSELTKDLSVIYPLTFYSCPYRSYISYIKSHTVLLDVGSDDMGDGFGGIETRKLFDHFVFDPEDSDIRNFWYVSNVSINIADNIILNLTQETDSIKFDSPELKKRFEGEARFLKAFHYFNLARLFGDCVFDKDYYDDFEAESNVSRTSVNKIYNIIISELEQAEQFLWSNREVEKGKATKGAAQALLSKVFLTRAGWRLDAQTGTMVQGDASNWSKAAEWAKKCMLENEYGLRQEYRHVFPTYEDDYFRYENNQEHVFFIESEEDENYFETLLYYGPKLSNGEGAYSSFVSEVELASSFDETDLRRETSFLTYVINQFNDTLHLDERGADDFWPGMNIPHIGKFLPDEEKYDFPPRSNASGTNYPLFRFAEVLLIYAEALNEANGGPDGESIEAFNRIRRRAGLDEWPNVKDLEGNIYPNTQDGFRRAIRQERRWELCFEGKRLYDLRRWGILVETFQARANAEDATEDDKIRAQNIQEYHNLFPIPQSEIDKHPNLTQNPGY